MNRLLEYKDPILLIDTAQDEYGDNSISHIEHLNGLFRLGASQNEVNYVESLGTDAHVYLDIENQFVKDNAYRLEGMYVVANLFGGKENQAWYKISSVILGQRKLLDNDINNIHARLTKCAALDLEES